MLKGPLLCCRPLSKLVSWLFPAWQVAKVNRNPLYPELQDEWDMGESSCDSLDALSLAML